MFHECIHSTGHSSRLSRGFDKCAAFGSADYSREELIAELGAAFLSSIAGITNTDLDDNRNAYIKGWLKALKSDKKAIILAGGKASKAADYVLGSTFEGDTEYTEGGKQ